MKQSLSLSEKFQACACGSSKCSSNGKSVSKPSKKVERSKKEDQFINLELKLLSKVSELHETGSNDAPQSNGGLFLCYLLGFHLPVSRKIGKDVSIK